MEKSCKKRKQFEVDCFPLSLRLSPSFTHKICAVLSTINSPQITFIDLSWHWGTVELWGPLRHKVRPAHVHFYQYSAGISVAPKHTHTHRPIQTYLSIYIQYIRCVSFADSRPRHQRFFSVSLKITC